MSDRLNQQQAGDLSQREQRLQDIIGQLKHLLGDIAAELGNPRRLARQGLELIHTLDRLDAADPNMPKPRAAVDHAFELNNEMVRAESGLPWGGGI